MTAAATSRFLSRSLASVRLGLDRQIGDHLVERRNGDQLAFEHVAAPLGFAKQVLGAPANDLHPMTQVFLHHLLERAASAAGRRPGPA